MKAFVIPNRVFSILTGCLLCAFSSVSHPATPVSTQAAAELLTRMHYKAPAAAKSLNKSYLSAELTARIDTIPVTVGDQIKKGGILLGLDCKAFELEGQRVKASIKASEAQIRLARQQLRRALKLVKQKSASQELADQRRSEVDRLNAELQGQKIQHAETQRKVNRCQISAPYDALILERLAAVGEIAQPGKPLLTILDTAHIDVSAQIRQSDALTLQQATAIWFETNEIRYPVTLRVLSAFIDSSARSREARLDFNADLALPGATGRLIWEVDGHFLPAHFLQQRNGMTGIFTLNDGKAHFNPIANALEGRPVRFDGANFSDSSALIIVKGRHGLVDGQPVTHTSKTN